MRQLLLSVLTTLLLFTLYSTSLFGQIQEPELRGFDSPRTPMDDGVRNGIGLNVVINNFGFGLGAEYKRVLAPYMEGYATFKITGLRDVSEQTFTDIFFGQQVVPNKYSRALAMPLTIGLRQRFFANEIADNYRIYMSGAVGPVLAFSYPYFDDRNSNGYREQFVDFFEPVNDVFTGWSDGAWHLGLAGELKLSLDIGRNFARLTSVEFGYMFYYFDSGIQIMQPNQPVPRQSAEPGEFPFELDERGELVMQPFFDAQRFFGTPQISLVFGRMW